MLKPKIFIPIVLILLFTVVLIQNTQPVTLTILLWKVSMSQIIFTPMVMLAGFVIGYVVGRVRGGKG